MHNISAFRSVALLLALFFLVFSVTMSNPIIFDGPDHNGLEYLYFYGPYGADIKGARDKCHKFGGKLADVYSQNLLQVIGNHIKVEDPAYINSWQGNTYTGTCIAVLKGPKSTNFNIAVFGIWSWMS